MLSIKHFSKILHNKNILNNLSLQIKRGEIAVLLGASGVGKSTLFRVLNTLETLDAGTIELDGKALDLATIHTHHQVGMVFQHFNLFEHLTVLQNITLALEKVAKKTPQQAEEIARELLKKYGLSDKADCMISQISGGQKQRLAIARTLALKPTIVCLDEPTSALDPQLTGQIAKDIKDLADQGYIVLVATHDIHLLEKLPCTIYLMEKGTIVESAPAKEFFTHSQNYPKIADFVAGT